MIDQDLPHLRGLESVDSRGGQETAGALMVAAMLLPTLAILGYGFQRYHEYFEPEHLALFAIIPALLAITLFRWLFTYSHVATGPDGITLSACCSFWRRRWPSSSPQCSRRRSARSPASG